MHMCARIARAGGGANPGFRVGSEIAVEIHIFPCPVMSELAVESSLPKFSSDTFQSKIVPLNKERFLSQSKDWFSI